MAVTHVGTEFVHNTAGSNNGASLNVNVPTGTQDGDYMVLVTYGSTASITVPAAWNLIADNNASTVMKFAIYHRVASSEPASYNITSTNNTRGTAISVFRGVESGTIDDGSIVGTVIDTVGTDPLSAASTLDVVTTGTVVFTARATRNNSLTEAVHSASDTELADFGADNGTNARTCALYLSGEKAVANNIAGLSINDDSNTVTHSITYNILLAPPVTPPAGTATASVTVNNPTVRISDTGPAGHASATETTNSPTARVRPNAGTTTASVTVNAPTISKSSNAPAGTTTASVTVNSPTASISDTGVAGTTTASVTVNDGIVETGMSAVAGTTSATATVNQPSVAIKSNTDSVTGTVTANAAVVGGEDAEASAGHASASVTVNDGTVSIVGNRPVVINAYPATVLTGAVASAGTATASVTTNDATIETTGAEQAPAGTASASSLSNSPVAAVKAQAGAVSATATVTNTSRVHPSSATGSVVVNNATASTVPSTSAPAGHASAAVTVNQPALRVRPDSATGVVSVNAATATVGPAAGTASGSVLANNASNAKRVNAGTVSATVTVNNPSVEAGDATPDAGHVSVSALANNASVSSSGQNPPIFIGEYPNTLIMGPAELYIGDFGATEPADADVAEALDPAHWTSLGGILDGVELSITTEYEEIELLQLPDQPLRRLRKRDLRVKMSLAEPTLENLALALNDNDPSTGVGYSSFTPSTTVDEATPLTYKALILHGCAPGFTSANRHRNRLVIMRKCLSVDNVEFAYKKEDQTVFTVTWAVHYVDESTRPFRIVDAI